MNRSHLCQLILLLPPGVSLKQSSGQVIRHLPQHATFLHTSYHPVSQAMCCTVETIPSTLYPTNPPVYRAGRLQTCQSASYNSTSHASALLVHAASERQARAALHEYTNCFSAHVLPCAIASLQPTVCHVAASVNHCITLSFKA